MTGGPHLDDLIPEGQSHDASRQFNIRNEIMS
jgi:hypothetical protein